MLRFLPHSRILMRHSFNRWLDCRPNGKVYAAFGPTCAAAADSGWVMGFDAAGLNSSGTLYLAPAAGQNAPGFTLHGLSADSTGNLYVFGQASFAYQAPRDRLAGIKPASSGNAFLKLSTENGIALTDYSKTASSGPLSFISAESSSSAGALVLPDFTDASGKVWHLALGADDGGNIYVLNRDSLGGCAFVHVDCSIGGWLDFVSGSRACRSILWRCRLLRCRRQHRKSVHT